MADSDHKHPIIERRNVTDKIPKEEQAAIVEQAIQKWMDEKFAALGKGILTIVFVGAFALLCKFLFLHGWSPQ